jgi:hypothetical protein
MTIINDLTKKPSSMTKSEVEDIIIGLIDINFKLKHPIKHKSDPIADSFEYIYSNVYDRYDAEIRQMRMLGNILAKQFDQVMHVDHCDSVNDIIFNNFKFDESNNLILN